MDSNSPYFICNVKYKPGSGWTAGLNEQVCIQVNSRVLRRLFDEWLAYHIMFFFICSEQIGSIMNNFTRNRPMYCVKLASGTRLQPLDNNEEETCDQSESEPESDEEALTVPIRVAPAGTNLVKKVNGPVRKFASVIPITPEKFQNVSSSMNGPTIVIPLSSDGPRGGNSLQPILSDQQLTHQKSNGGPVPTDIRTMKEIPEGLRYSATSCTGTNDLNPPPVKLIRMESPVAGSSRQSEWQSRVVARVTNYEEDNFPDSPDFNLRIDRITDGQNGVYDIANIKQERNTDFHQNGLNNGLPMQPPFQPTGVYCPSVLEIEEDEDSDADYNDADNDSLCTTATAANRELREAGINFRDLKSGLAAKIEKMDEAMVRTILN